ncbi:MULTISPECIES: hypothetical protein [Acinetobacter calcoaceticus/baumannii complex]|jgi:hypothetical protein|uniref:Uncharacterized protein n=1 Tax=Acinetobacter lactucae TaxID=1785128 RepID=R8YU14_9GAMM|nr:MULTISPECIES: hypothetical protein [Acinetobacter calcoaceticus/baumannii complex]ARD28762.1 hypothetical protein OTEC02_08310 [Acinetobacter lactucae]EOQ72863.1 hypothetical protein F929_02798 [Acinetobacter lactucae]MBJ8438772.1 hypothetical protein [Acinetobacter lactucae]MCU4349066.1 hypothetical protein [Acinetobacter lactucae]
MKILGLDAGSETEATASKILTNSEMTHAAILEIVNICGLVACIVLALIGWMYGAKFLKKKNILLGLECWIVAFSATNFVAYMLTAWNVNLSITMFLDSFSRSFGMPIIAVLGLMALTHNYKPSPLKEFLLFAFSFAGTFVVFLADFFDEIRPYFYIVMWVILVIYLCYFIICLVRAREIVHALATTLTVISSLSIAIVYDFFPIPGDDNHMIFMTLAFITWGFSIIQLYYAYTALERSQNVSMQSFVPARQ